MAIIIKDANGNVLPQNPEDLNDYNIRSDKYKIPSTVDESHTHLKKQIEDFAHTHPISEVEGIEVNKHKKVVYSRTVGASPANSGIAIALTKSSDSGASLTYFIDFEGTTMYGNMDSMFRYSLLIHVRNNSGTIVVQPNLFALKDRTELNFYYQVLADRINVYVWHTGAYWNIQVISSEFSSGTTRGVASSDCSNIDSLPSSTAITKQIIHNNQTLDLSPYLQTQYNGSFNYLGGGYVSGGTEKPNNVVFGAGKLKLQMLAGSNIGAPSGWYDTLWLSSYTGGDVKGSNLLIFNKGADRIGFSRQDFDSGAWGTYREIWHTGNFNPSNYFLITGGRVTGTINAYPSDANHDSIVISKGGDVGQYGAPAGKYPIACYESYGWNFTVQNLAIGAFKIMLADRTTELFKVMSNGDTYTKNDTYINGMLFTREVRKTATNDAIQKAEARQDGSGSPFARVHKHGWNSSGVTDRFREAWYDGSGYVNIDAISGGVQINGTPVSLNGHSHATLTNGVGIVGYPYDGSTARSWYVGAGTGITVGSVSVSLTDIASGSSTVGTVRYNGTTKSSARFYGGTSTPTNSTSLHYDGTFLAFGLRYGSGGSSSYSDIRMKKDVGSLNYAEQLILKLKPKQFRFKDEFEPPEEVVPSKVKAEIPTSRTSNRQQLHYGLIAQDVEKIVDELGINRPAFLKKPDQENEYYSINYVELIAPMIDVIQRLEKRITELEMKGA